MGYGSSKRRLLIVFRSGQQRLGIDARHVREVTRALPLAVPMSNARGIVGLVTMRGKSVAVVDLAVALGIESEEQHQDTKMIAVHHDGGTVCLRVEHIEGLHEMAEADLEDAPAIYPDVDQWLEYLTRSETGELIGVIDVNRILSRVSIPKVEPETPLV